MAVAFYCKFSTFPPNLVRIGPMVKKWLPIFVIQDGGSLHLEFWWICIFNVKESWVLWQIFNIPTKFGEDWSNSKEMATDFRNLRWRRSPSLILVNMHFQYCSCVLLQILNIPTKFGEDWSNSKEMATDFRNSSWRRPPSWILLNMHF